jgi:hypothetical protein
MSQLVESNIIISTTSPFLYHVSDYAANIRSVLFTNGDDDDASASVISLCLSGSVVGHPSTGDYSPV